MFVSPFSTTPDDGSRSRDGGTMVLRSNQGDNYYSLWNYYTFRREDRMCGGTVSSVRRKIYKSGKIFLNLCARVDSTYVCL